MIKIYDADGSSDEIVFNFVGEKEMKFKTNDIKSNKSIGFKNDANAENLTWFFNIQVGFGLVFPQNIKHDDSRFTLKTWICQETGNYKLNASFDGVNWWVSISQSIFE